MDMEENEFHQRQPLLAADPDDILLENGLSSLGDNSPNNHLYSQQKVYNNIVGFFRSVF